MSVPTWKRKQSSAEFVNQVFELNKRIGKIMSNKPKKYKENYGDAIIKTAISALLHVQTAETIYMHQNTSEHDYYIRRDNLLLARGEIQNIATVSRIFLELVRTNDYESEGNHDENNRRSAKIFNQELEIGERCETCNKLIAGVLKSDSSIFKSNIKSD